MDVASEAILRATLIYRANMAEDGILRATSFLKLRRPQLDIVSGGGGEAWVGVQFMIQRVDH